MGVGGEVDVVGSIVQAGAVLQDADCVTHKDLRQCPTTVLTLCLPSPEGGHYAAISDPESGS